MYKNWLVTCSFLLILFVITAAFGRIIMPFIIDLITAAALAHLFSPLFGWLQKTLKGWNKTAATLGIVAVVLTVVLPILGLGLLISSEASNFISILGDRAARLPDLVQGFLEKPGFQPYLPLFNQLGLKTKIATLAGSAAKTALALTQSIFVGTYKSIFHFFIVLVVLFFLFLDGPALVLWFKSLLPFRDSDAGMLVGRFKSITNATVKGTFIIGLLEGTVGGGLFAAFGVHSPVLWATIMAALSMLPAVGTNLIIVPVGIFKLLTGHTAAGVGILVLGAGFVAVSQNVLKPKLVGNVSGLHPALFLLSSFGGIAWLGLIGFLIGPIIASLFTALWDLFGKHFKQLLEEKNNQTSRITRM